MKNIVLTILVLLALSSMTLAGQIYGSLSTNGVPIQGAQVTIIINGQSQTFFTEADGTYRIFVRDLGKAQIKVSYRNKVGISTVISYDEPVRYDFELVESSTSITLTRK